MADYSRDFMTTLPLLKGKASEFSEGTWNKFDSDIGETLLKLLASSSHTVDYYFRKYLDNLLLPCDNWTSKNYIWELIGYKPPYIRADYLMVQLYWPKCGLLSYVPIYMYTPFTVVADGVTYNFMAAEDYLIPPMTSRVNIKLVQGALKTIELDATKIKDNRIKISDTPINYDLVTLSVSGTKWKQVRNVFYSPETSKIFSLHREEDGIYLYLHKTWQNYVDAYNKTMKVYFIVSDQTFDDYTEDCLQIRFSGEILDTNGLDVSSFYRIFPLIGKDTGVEEQPSAIEGDRVITTDDYTNKALLYPGVATCKAYSWDNSAVVREPFKVVLIATGPSGPLRTRTKEALESYLTGIGSKLIKVEVLDPEYFGDVVRVILDIGEFKGTLAEIQIRLSVKAALQKFYSLGERIPGKQVSVKELNSLLLRADSRILFVDTAIQNRIGQNPFIIPVLDSVILITEAKSVPLQDSGFIKDHMRNVNALYRKDTSYRFMEGTVYKASYVNRDNTQIREIIPQFVKEFNENLDYIESGRVGSNNGETGSVIDTISIVKQG